MPSRSEWIAITWIPRWGSCLSMMGSSSVMYMILSDWQHKLTKPNHRLMLLFTIFDFLQSVAYAVSTLAHPRDPDVYGSMGNDSTCKLQFFFVTLGLAVPMYNASLSLYFLLHIRYRMHPTYFSSKIEPFLHAVSVLVPLVVAFVPITMDEVRGESNAVCAINFSSQMIWAYIVAVMTSFFVCSSSMVLICCHVSRQSNRMRRYSYGTAQMQHRTSEKWETKKQAILYISAFSLTFIFPAISMMTAQKNYIFRLEVLREFFFPLQGFWNFLLYIRPSVAKVKASKPDKCIFEAMWEVVFHSKEISKELPKEPHKIEDETMSGENSRKVNLSNLISQKIDPLSNGEKDKKHIVTTIEDFDEDRDSSNDEIEGSQFTKVVRANDLRATDDLTRPNAKYQSCASVSSNCHIDDKPHVIEFGSADENNNYGTTRRTSLVILATAETNEYDYDLDSLESTDNNV